MNTKGPIVVIDDDPDDKEMLQELFTSLNLPNQLVMMENGEQALAFLQQPAVRPFLVLSDVNMPKMNGFVLRRKIEDDPMLAAKCIPFIFCTTRASPRIVVDAYSMSVQGIFQKPNVYQEWRIIIESIVGYWSHCISPNQY